MKKIIKVVLLGGSIALGCGAAFGEGDRDEDLLRKYQNIQNHSQLFDFLQHYYFKSSETALAMKASMDSRQLEQINQQLQLMNKNLNALITLEKQRLVLSKG